MGCQVTSNPIALSLLAKRAYFFFFFSREKKKKQKEKRPNSLKPRNEAKDEVNPGRRPVKVSVKPFQRPGEAPVPEGTRSGPLGLGEPRGLTGRGAKRRRWKPQWGFQGHVPDHRKGCPPAAFRRRRNSFPKGAFFFASFFLRIEKERRKPPALRRGRHPGRGTTGLFTPTVKPFWDLTAQKLQALIYALYKG